MLAVAKTIVITIRDVLRARPAQVGLVAIIALMLWGFHGELELLGKAWPEYESIRRHQGRPVLIPGLPWDYEALSFWGGLLLVVILPILVIKVWFKEPLSDYGLGLPAKGRGRFAVLATILLIAILLGPFWIGAQDADMQATYPFYQAFRTNPPGVGTFIVYQLTYLPFFIAIEFIYRGFLLFGFSDKAHIRDIASTAPTTPLHRGAFVLSMLSYTAWHLGKPIPELWGTPLWGLIAGAIAWHSRSIWPVVTAHWLLNVWLDLASLGVV